MVLIVRSHYTRRHYERQDSSEINGVRYLLYVDGWLGGWVKMPSVEEGKHCTYAQLIKKIIEGNGVAGRAPFDRRARHEGGGTDESLKPNYYVLLLIACYLYHTVHSVQLLIAATLSILPCLCKRNR